MYIEQLPNGKVRYGQRYRDYMTGKVKRVTITYPTDTRNNRRMAQMELDERVRNLSNAPRERRDLTLIMLLELYLEAQQDKVKPDTLQRHNSHGRRCVEIIGNDALVERLTADYIRKRLNSTGEGAGTKNNRLKFIKGLLRWAYQNDYLSDTKCIDRLKPWEDVPQRSKIEDKFLEKDELKLLLNEIDIPLYRDMTEVLALTGLRIGELTALEVEDIDLDARLIHVSRTYNSNVRTTTTAKTYDSHRDIYVQDELFPLITLLVHRAGTGLLFTYNGHNVLYNPYNRYIQQLSAAVLGREITTHVLRHTHTSLCAEAGMNLEEIRRRLGHHDSKITRDVYLHVTDRMKQQSNEKMDRIKILS